MKQQTKMTGVNLEIELRNLLKQKAAEERRTLSGLIRHVLWQYINNEENQK